MKKRKIVLSILASITMLFIFSTVSKASNETVLFDVTVTNDYTASYEVLNIVNQERKNQGLNELKMDKDLLDAAMIRASEIVLNFSHTRPNGTSCFSISSKAYGENIAGGYGTPTAVMTGWMNSSGHRANILTSDYTSIGVGAIKYGSTYYWVQLFGISDLVEASSIPQNKVVTNSIDMLASNVELYYNSIQSLYYSQYSKTGYQTTIVVKNPGWESRCTTIDPKKLDFASSNNSVFTVDSQGVIHCVSAGKATLTVTLKQNKSISTKVDISIIGNISNLNISNIKDQVYTGSNIKPNVTIKDKNYTLLNGKDYKLEYSNNKSYGTATVTITGIGNYSGQTKKTFKIIPNKVNNLKVSSRATDSLTVNWKKISGVTGYKVYLYNNSKNKYEYYGTTNKTSLKIKNLKAGTTYKIRVRAYKNISGTQYFGEYAKTLKTTTTPKKVTNLKSTSITKNSIKLNWKKTSGASGYKIYLYNNSKGKYEYYGKTTKTSLTIKKLKSKKSYKVKVRAYKTLDNKQYFGQYSSDLKIHTK